MDDVLVLHNEDAAAWSEYILTTLDKKKFKLKTSALLDSTFDFNPERSFAKVKVLIVIVSEGHLNFLFSHSGVGYRKQIRNAGTTLILLCGVEDVGEEENSGEVGRLWKNRIPGYDSCLRFTHSQHHELLKTTMIKVEDLDDSTKTVALEGQGHSAGKMKKKKTKCKFKVIPSKARVEEATPMVLCFQDELPGSKYHGVDEAENEASSSSAASAAAADEMEMGRDVVTVAFGSNAELLIPTERINRSTFQFLAPEHSAGEVPVRVIVNGEPVGQGSITFQSLEADLTLSIGQIYMFLLNRLLGLLEERDLLTLEVDRCLGELLGDDESNTIPIQAFEQLFSLSTESKGSQRVEFPTLLHLAARYNLIELASKLMDLPDADVACRLHNVRGLTPDELARSRGRLEIAQFLEAFRLPKQSGEVLYEKFSPPKQPIETSNADSTPLPESPKPDDDPYMLMTDIKFDERYNRRGLTLPHPTLSPHPLDSEPAKEKTKVTEVRTSLVSFGQDELVSIQEQVKSQELTISEAEVLFKEWQMRYSSSGVDAFQSPRMTQMLSKQHKTKSSIVDKILKKSKSLSKHGKSNSLVSSSSFQEEPLSSQLQNLMAQPMDPLQQNSSPRSSSASNSSRDSCLSKGSYMSGIETVDEEDFESEYDYPRAQRNQEEDVVKRKSSANLEQLEEDLKNPNAPQPPPPPSRKPPVSTPSKPELKHLGSSDTDYMDMDNLKGDCRQHEETKGAKGPKVAPKSRKMSCPTAPVTLPFPSPLRKENTIDLGGGCGSPVEEASGMSPADEKRAFSSGDDNTSSANNCQTRKLSLPQMPYGEGGRQRPPPPPLKK